MKKKILTGITVSLLASTMSMPVFGATVTTKRGTTKVSDTTYNSAKKAFAAAQNKVTNAKNTAKKNLDTANAKVKTLNTQIADLNKKINTTKDTIAKLEKATKTPVTQAEIDELKAKEAQQKRFVSDWESELRILKTNLENYGKQLNEKRVTLVQVDSELNSKKADLNSLKKQKSAKEAEIKSLQSEYNKRKKWVENDNIENEPEYKALQNATANVTAIQKDIDAKEKEVTSAQSDVATKEAAYNEKAEKFNEGAFGFYTWVAENNSAEKADAENALKVLTEARYASDTHKGDPDDATSLDNMKDAITLIREGNSLRLTDSLGIANGAKALNVSHTMMAAGQSNANRSANANIFGHCLQFPVGENLAGGYDKPYEGWYTREKDMYNIGETASIEKYGEYQTGHYTNLMDADYNVTGFGCNTKKTQISEDWIIQSKTASQVFKTSGLITNTINKTLINFIHITEGYGEGGVYITSTGTSAENYEAQFNQYYDSVNPQKAQNEFNTAKDTLTTKQNELNSLKTELTKAKKTQSEAQAVCDDLKDATKYNSIKNTYDNVDAEIKMLGENIPKIETQISSLQAQADSINKEIKTIDSTISKTNTEIASTTRLRDTATKNYNETVKLRQEKEDSFKSYDKNIKDLATARTTLATQQSQLSSANNLLQTAQKDVTAKQNAYNSIKTAPVFSTTVKSYPTKITDKDYTYLNTYITKMMSSKVGWKYENGGFKYYSEKDGKPYTGWHYMSKAEGEKTPHWSYFGKDGKIYTGWRKMGKAEGEKTEHMSYFGDNGWLRTGWQQMGKGTNNPDGKASKHWSYFGDNGWLRTGWQQMGKGTKNPDGNTAKHWSYFGSNGWLRTGIVTLGKADGEKITHKSYFGGNGWLVVNKRFSVAGKTYTADARGWIK